MYEHCLDKRMFIHDCAYEFLPTGFSDTLPSGADEDEMRMSAGILCACAKHAPSLATFLPSCTEPKKDTVIAYLENPASAEALAEFFALFENCRADKYYDFDAACEAVYNNKADMCILPTENSTDGRLPGFYNLASRYELFCVAVADVTGYDTAVRTRFSLFCTDRAVYAHGEDIVCLTQFDINDTLSIGYAVSCAEYFGVHCRGINCIPEVHIKNDCKASFAFEGKRDDIVAFLFYLYLRSVPYILQGIYDRI